RAESSLLSLRRRFLRSLQRVDRGRAGESAPLTRRSLSLRDQHITIARPRHSAFDHQQILVEVDTANAQVTHGHLIGAEMPRHALAGKNTGRKARSAN